MDKEITLLGAVFAFIGGINIFLTGGACPVCYAELAGGTALAGYGLIRKTGSCQVQKDEQPTTNKQTTANQTTNTDADERSLDKTNEKKN